MPVDKEQRQKKIGERLKELRISRGYSSYRNFADEHDLEPKQYWRLEEGQVDFKISSLFRVLDIHEITIQEFFHELDIPRPSD